MPDPESLVQQVWDNDTRTYWVEEWDPEVGAGTLTLAMLDALFENQKLKELKPSPPFVAVSQATFDRIEAYYRLTGEDSSATVGDVPPETPEEP